MKFVALCPTYRRPALVASMLACWLDQDYPKSDCHLMILDDGGTFDTQRGENWEVLSVPTRFPSMPDKYQYMIQHRPEHVDAYVSWDDDDIYLPGFLRSHAACLADHEYSQPYHNRCHYGQHLMDVIEPYHTAMAVRADLLHRVGGYPPSRTCMFDKLLQDRLRREAASWGEPWRDPQLSPYIMGWSRPGPMHSSCLASSATDETFYDKCVERYPEVPPVGTLVPEYDQRTQQVFAAIREGRTHVQ